MMCVAHRRIKDGGAGREIYGDSCNCWSKKRGLGTEDGHSFGSTAYLEEKIEL